MTEHARRSGQHDDTAQLASRIEAALGGRRISTLRFLARGSDHIAYEVNGDLIARIASSETTDTAAAITREIQILEFADRVSPIPVPDVLGADPEHGLLILRKLIGVSLLDAPSDNPDALVDQLAQFLLGLQVVDGEHLPPAIETDPYPITTSLADVSADLAVIATAVTREELRLIEDFLSTAPPAEPTRAGFCHNDLGAEHILAATDRTTLTGIIDWSDAAITDVARDLGRIYRDLGPSTAQRVLDQLTLHDTPQTWRRTRFHARCALLEDLAYGLTSGDARYSDAALTNLTRTFANA